MLFLMFHALLQHTTKFLHYVFHSNALCVGYNPKEDHYSTKRGLFLPVLLLSSSINDAEAYYCVFSSSVDLIEIS